MNKYVLQSSGWCLVCNLQHRMQCSSLIYTPGQVVAVYAATAKTATKKKKRSPAPSLIWLCCHRKRRTGINKRLSRVNSPYFLNQNSSKPRFKGLRGRASTEVEGDQNLLPPSWRASSSLKKVWREVELVSCVGQNRYASLLRTQTQTPCWIGPEPCSHTGFLQRLLENCWGLDFGTVVVQHYTE